MPNKKQKNSRNFLAETKRRSKFAAGGAFTKDQAYAAIKFPLATIAWEKKDFAKIDRLQA